jgi:hypothetical protein
LIILAADRLHTAEKTALKAIEAEPPNNAAERPVTSGASRVNIETAPARVIGTAIDADAHALPIVTIPFCSRNFWCIY